MIDPHVHLRDWNQKDKETVIHGMRVAASLAKKPAFRIIFMVVLPITMSRL